MQQPRTRKAVDTPSPSSRTRLDLLLHGLRVPSVRREDIAAGVAAITADPDLDDIALISVLVEAICGRLRRAENDGAMVHAERARAEARSRN